MSIIDMDLHKCDKCSGPRQEFWDYKDQVTTHICGQCGTIEEEYYDNHEECEVYKHYARYGVVDVVLKNGFEQCYKQFTKPPSREDILEALEEIRNSDLDIAGAFAYGQIEGKWMQFSLDGEVIESPLMQEVAHL